MGERVRKVYRRECVECGLIVGRHVLRRDGGLRFIPNAYCADPLALCRGYRCKAHEVPSRTEAHDG